MISYASVSKKGNRDINEDSIGTFVAEGLSGFIICDGLGGHGMGDVASSLVVRNFKDILNRTSRIDPAKIRNIFSHFNSDLLNKQDELNAQNKMKTTAAILLLNNDFGYIAHIGDTRVYLFNNGRFVKRTIDHSVPEALRLSGQIDESEIRHHPDRNKLLRVLGDKERALGVVISDPIPLIRGMKFLICSDGFWEYIDEPKMEYLLSETNTPQEWLEMLTFEVEKNGLQRNMDNYSAIAVWV